MEVDGSSAEDSDATVAGEEGVSCGSQPLRQSREGTVTAQNLEAEAGAGVVTAAATQPTDGTDSRASDGNSEAGPASPSLLHGYAAPKSGLESQTGYHKYVRFSLYLAS